jgi:hypothetical protein
VTRTLLGHVDNSLYPQLSVTIRASYTVPANVQGPVPIMIELGNTSLVGRGARGGSPQWHQLAIARGWGYGSIVPGSIQADTPGLATGIIPLTARGRFRQPDEWGVLRAWQWGVSRLVDYFETHAEAGVDPTRIGIAGLTIYGKGAIVAHAFEPRLAAAFVGSSGAAGIKPYRRTYGERLENIAGREIHQWMAGNFIRYASEDPRYSAADLPVDTHALLALCAPRPCFVSCGTVANGEARWVDPQGSYMAVLLAAPAYHLLGGEGWEVSADVFYAPMPPVNTVAGGSLAWRQHQGGVDLTPNWPTFLEWADRQLTARENAVALP